MIYSAQNEQHSVLLGKGKYLAPYCTAYNMDQLTVCLTVYPQPVKTGLWHAHERSMISFVLKGKNLENRQNDQIGRLPGMTSFYYTQEPHQNIYLDFPSKHVSIELDTSFYDRYGLTETDVHRTIQKIPDATLLFAKILKDVSIDDRLTKPSIEMLLVDLVFLAKRNEIAVGGWVGRVNEFLQDNWNAPLSLTALAMETNVHPVTISKNFRKYFACTLGEYVRKLKVQKAMALLKASNSSLTDTAYACGFADQSHFTRTFKQQTGFLPKEYQRL